MFPRRYLHASLQSDALDHTNSVVHWMGQHFQLHLCLEFCQELLKCTNIHFLPDLQVFVAMYSQVHRPLWTMLGQLCQHHSKGTSEAWLSSSHLWAEIHSQVAVVVSLTQKSETQACNGMAGWARVSRSWEKTAPLNNLWPCWSFALLPALPICFHTATLHTWRDWLALSQTVASRPLCLQE